jgi:hypothetical protein
MGTTLARGKVWAMWTPGEVIEGAVDFALRRTGLSGFSEELGDIDFQRFCDALEHVDGGVAFAALELAEVCLMHIRQRAKLLLREFSRAP